MFRVRVHGYNNPTNKRILAFNITACCDGSDSDVCGGSQRCDNRFRFCLRSPGNRAIGTSTCMSTVLNSTQTNWNGAPIDFTQPTWLGLDNPLMLSGISTAWEVCDNIMDSFGTTLYTFLAALQICRTVAMAFQSWNREVYKFDTFTNFRSI